MNRTFLLGQHVAGCVVAYTNDGPEVVLRCPCGQTFPVPVATAGADGAALRCPECPRPTQYHAFIQTEPTPGTKTARMYALMVGGMHYRDAAGAVGVAEATGEKCFYRYLLPRQLRARIAALEKELADLRQRKAS